MWQTPDAVTYEARGHIAVITLNRPEARNAVSAAVADGLEAAIDAVEEDDEIWVAILAANTSGQERPVFCAGADLKAIQRGEGAKLVTERGGFAGYVFRQRSKPVIVAVDGLATAGGFEIVLASDVVVASRRSAFGLAEVMRNLIANGGGLFRLPRVIGRHVAMDAIVTGEPISAERAFQLGIVSRLVHPGDAFDAALDVAGQVVAAGPLAVRASRQVVLAANRSDDECIALGNELLAGLMRSNDTREGLAAFIEKRAPNWKGR